MFPSKCLILQRLGSPPTELEKSDPVWPVGLVILLPSSPQNRAKRGHTAPKLACVAGSSCCKQAHCRPGPLQAAMTCSHPGAELLLPVGSWAIVVCRAGSSQGACAG
ncbi:hypothetical protein LEMLEM_LOCUS26172 [Lemmus lemmus]